MNVLICVYNYNTYSRQYETKEILSTYLCVFIIVECITEFKFWEIVYKNTMNFSIRTNSYTNLFTSHKN